MGTYPESFLNQIKSKVDIVDLISTYIDVQKRGRDYWACCPFHNEKTPSFQIRSDHQYYKCYGCGKYGNIFNFMMDYEKMTFSEAVEYLANKAGLELPEQIVDKEYEKRKALLNKIYEINKETAKFYHMNLTQKEGQEGINYCQQRGLTWETIQTFGIGYSYDFNSLPKYLESIGYDRKTLALSGVIGINDNDYPYDFFGNRLIIPIINASGKVIGFTGRLLEKKPDFAKYKNTGSTLAFDKKKNLFGINILKKYVHGSVRSVILVEGHMDLISLYQAGIKNVVASMGTSLTIEQCRELKRYADVVYVSFDGDSAGQHATLRGLDMLKEQGLEVKVVCLTNNFDPDDYVNNYGKEGYEKLLDEALPLIDFKLYNVKKNYKLNSYDSRKNYANDAINVLSGLDKVESSIYVDEVSKNSGINKDILINQIDKTIPYSKNDNEKKEVKETSQDNNASIKAARFVLASILNQKSYVNILEMDKSLFTDENHLKVYEYIYECIKCGKEPIIGDVIDILENEESGKIIEAIDDKSIINQVNFYNECVKKLKKDYINRELTNLVNELKMETDDNKKLQIKEKILQITRLQK
jgi:DNA primase